MGKTKVAITLEQPLLEKVDRLVKRHVFANRSQAIQEAVAEKLDRVECGRLAKECGKLDPAFEQAMADEGLSEALQEWPKY